MRGGLSYGHVAVHGTTGMVTQVYSPGYVFCVRDNSSGALGTR
jgi:hypothetical protein